MEKWLVYSLITLTLWGIWGVLLKKASSSLEWYQVYVFANTAIVIAILTLVLIHGKNLTNNVTPSIALIAFLSGVTGTLGYVFLIRSLEAGGNASIVIPLTSLYPLITVALSAIVLGENVTFRKAVGAVLAVAAIVLLSLDS